ncbi:helix-turn-helix transcriptional regulator [Micromonospora zhanjiangensis]|uniref:LuxR C-terminal-related transcriptional regulator n=1 Tax=Micromonospora zhanjiangensis TaxID=1522057 RepID=A0ABV8KI41_9ACTN
MLRDDASTAQDAVASLGLSDKEGTAALTELRELGLLVTHSPTGALRTARPEQALVRLIGQGQRAYAAYHRENTRNRELIERLVDGFLPLATAAPQEVTVRTVTDPRQVAVLLDELTEQTQEEILSMHPGPVPPRETIEDALPRGRMLAERGLRSRSIYQRRLVTVPYVLENLRQLTRLRHEIRVASDVPVRLIISDGRRAIVPADPDDGAAGALVITGPVLVRSLTAVFSHFWSTSRDLDDDSRRRAAGPLSPEEQTLLKMLAAGMKDEKIARNIGVSLRTVARIVADLMERLDADSRFQAGVRAARLGWLD